MTAHPLLVLFLLLLSILLLILWWVRGFSRGLIWVTVAILGAVGLSYLSSLLFRVPPYHVSCPETVCAGWAGYPYPVYHLAPDGTVTWDGPSFVLNSFFYDAALLAFSALVAGLARGFRWGQRAWRTRVVFILVVVLLPLATLPIWVPPPQPPTSIPERRLVNNAARAWRWQLHMRGWMDRRLALEDVLATPEGPGSRVCFRVYTWFYLPYRRVVIDLDEAGVRARDGQILPLSARCYVNRIRIRIRIEDRQANVERGDNGRDA